MVEMDDEDDHIHLPVNCVPKVTISDVVNNLKSVSSRLRHPRAVLVAVPNFASSCVGSSNDVIRNHNEQQQTLQ